MLIIPSLPCNCNQHLSLQLILSAFHVCYIEKKEHIHDIWTVQKTEIVTSAT